MNLTSLANVRQWLNSSTTTDDALLTRLIADASRMIFNYVQRADFGLQTVTETVSGRNTPKLPLRNWPVIAVNSLTINGVVIPASTGATNYGYVLENSYGSSAGKPQMIAIIGSAPNTGGGWPSPYGYYGQSPPILGNSYTRPFGSGYNNISTNYSFGYCVQSEAQTIPATPSYTLTPLAPYGAWSGDNGVSYANGTPMTATTGTPSVGQ